MLVDVAADRHLVAETICAALGSRGVHTELVAWAGEDVGAVPRAPRPRSAAEPGASSQLLLVVCDLGLPGRLHEARALGERQRIPWVVVDSSGPGPAWGALLEAGARTVVLSSISLDGLVEVLGTVARGESTIGELERRVLIHRWHEAKAVPEHLLSQLQGVDEHDREILVMLYKGSTIHAVAERFELSDTAVRNQVKAVLRRMAQASQGGGVKPW